MRRTKRVLRSMSAIRFMAAFLLLFIWSGTMYYVTRQKACAYYEYMEYESETFLNRITKWSRLSDIDETNQEEEGIWAFRMLDAIKWGNGMSIFEYDDEEIDDECPLQTAVIFFDSEKNILYESGSYLYFWYATEDEWKESKDTAPYGKSGWIDISELDTADFEEIRVLTDLRIRGRIDGNEVIPVKIDYCYEDEEGNWINLLDRSGTVDEEELVTIYVDEPEMTTYDKNSPIPFQGKTFENLVEFLKWQWKNYDGVLWDERGNDLHSYIGYDSWYFYENNDLDFLESDNYKIGMLTAIRGEPWRYAINDLLPFYFWTLAAFGAFWFLFTRNLERKLIYPIQEINKGISNQYAHISRVDQDLDYWKEIKELREHYREIQDKLRMQKNEITRLQTALNYSKKAEETRRQMTSNIAHELKTPLAIIHSYSEGLKEKIAEEKKEEYYDVILSETERMDGMVLEMLDLSRLEAGKVKLARDEFDLNLVVEDVFEKMTSFAAEKDLKLHFDYGTENTVYGDETRIYQVVLNFVSNAIRYTPEKGEIFVRIKKGRGTTTFSIENTSKPFSVEELSKVWETYYRADKARSTKGTGLGLAIAKNIIALHGGKCSVRNTKIGVEFEFVLWGWGENE